MVKLRLYRQLLMAGSIVDVDAHEYWPLRPVAANTVSKLRQYRNQCEVNNINSILGSGMPILDSSAIFNGVIYACVVW